MLKKITIFLILLFCCSALYLPNSVSADNAGDKTETDPKTGLTKPTLQIDIPAFKGFSDNKGIWIGEYVQAIFNYGIGIIAILATIILMFGGVLWLTAGGNQGQVGEAKAWIGASLTGLVIALSSYTILYIINPKLVSFGSLSEYINNIPEVEIENKKSTLTIHDYVYSNVIDYIKENEGQHIENGLHVPYQDSLGHWTIGYGHLINSNEKAGWEARKGMTEMNALQYLQNDIKKAKGNALVVAYKYYVNFSELSEARQAVLTDMAFNMGSSGLAGFAKMWGAIRNENWTKAADEIRDSKQAEQIGERNERNAKIMESNSLSSP